ncbi:MAG: hypothetical protein B9S32_10160 [Verrucomicrobia bacterium Tous-C9LFEB]|nr:MAG: hypothetical protein B9S32_10160 [Verrucomicrobia bacterium Tous-C9LFEB]
MDFDWSLFASKEITQNEVCESFEDPFSLRLLPDAMRFAQQSRYFCLGRTLGGKPIFSLYTSTGKVVRVITSRSMTAEETFFYDRKSKESL